MLVKAVPDSCLHIKKQGSNMGKAFSKTAKQRQKHFLKNAWKYMAGNLSLTLVCEINALVVMPEKKRMCSRRGSGKEHHAFFVFVKHV